MDGVTSCIVLGAEVNAANAAWQEWADAGGDGPYPDVSVHTTRSTSASCLCLILETEPPDGEGPRSLPTLRVARVRRRAFALAACAGFALAVHSAAAGPAPISQTPFRGTISGIDATQAKRMTGVSWRPGCPVSLRDLRLLRLTHWRFDAKVVTGRLVVHRDVARDVVGVFRRLYAAGVPIRRMVPIDAYGASDFRSIEADNTSAFNCRYVDGTRRWSEHAYGRVIDINPIENPYVSGGRTSHRASVPYLDRGQRRPGMAHEGGALVRAFDAIGWGWGGRWTSVKDYQHFSASGS